MTSIVVKDSMSTSPLATSNIQLLAARAQVAALREELKSTAPAHGPGTYWRRSREQELVLDEQRLARLEQLEAALQD